MSLTTIQAYRELYTNRHGIACPLTDAQIVAAVASASVDMNDHPNKDNGVLTEMEALVATDFPDVNQYRSDYEDEITPPVMTLDNASVEGFDVNFTAATGGNEPYSYQLQIAPDETGSPGTWADEGAAQEDTTEIVVTGLTTGTPYWARIVVTDGNAATATSNEETITTA